MSLFSKWAEKEHGLGVQVGASLLAGILFVGVIPYLLLVICPRWDMQLGVEVISPGATTLLAGGLLVALGWPLALWTIGLQLTLGRGTPLPMVPTRDLLTSGPFKYCRNPMTLGTILAYLGISIAAATTIGVALVLIFASALLVYLKRVEEKELAERFGDAYLAYRREVPFIIPRFSRRG